MSFMESRDELKAPGVEAARLNNEKPPEGDSKDKMQFFVTLLDV